MKLLTKILYEVLNDLNYPNTEIIIEIPKNNKSSGNLEEYIVNKKVLSDNIKMMHEFIEFKHFKKIIEHNDILE